MQTKRKDGGVREDAGDEDKGSDNIQTADDSDNRTRRRTNVTSSWTSDVKTREREVRLCMECVSTYLEKDSHSHFSTFRMINRASRMFSTFRTFNAHKR